MRVYVQIINTHTGKYQFEMIDEPVMKTKEIENALKHLGVDFSTVEWEYFNNINGIGTVSGTTKKVTVISI